ncbi:MAG: hypothetical protein A2Y40_01695 [Candidatus Margulisbacteria bacterium GWF2_35_9]|nr:MAG: hypothetical protein A2Y40_01695 [Candidatus Margulisbacteria bacterium GWF2_35_9]
MKRILSILALFSTLILLGCIAKQSGSDAPLTTSKTWHQVNASANWEAREKLAVVTFNNKIWVIGGSSPTTPGMTDVWSSPDGITWTKVAVDSSTGGRFGHEAVAFNGEMYIMGGLVGGSTFKNDVWASSDGITWTQKTSNAGWVPRTNFAAVVHNNLVWVMGGVNASNQCLSDIWNSSDGITWTLVTANAVWGARSGLRVFEFNNSMILHSGRTTTNMIPLSVKADVWSSNNGTSWVQLVSEGPYVCRSYHGAGVADNMMFFMGGTNAVGAYIQDTGFSSDGSNWGMVTVASPFPDAKKFMGSAGFAGKFWVIGGINQNSLYQNDVWAFY